MRLEELATLCEAKLLRGDPNWVVEHISTDTRALGRGDCFIALRGPRFDGHEFILDAASRGASAAVVSNPTRAMNSPSALALLQVQDTLTALHKLATNYRRLMPPTTRVITISGASGKTTTKEMIASILGAAVQRGQDARQSQQPHRHAIEPAHARPMPRFRRVRARLESSGRDARAWPN